MIKCNLVEHVAVIATGSWYQPLVTLLHLIINRMILVIDKIRTCVVFA